MNILSTIDNFVFGENAYLGGGRFGPITKPQLEMVIVYDGAVSVDVDGHKSQVIEGYATLVLSQDYLCYDYRKGIDTKVVWCEAVVPEESEGLLALMSSQPAMLPVSRRMIELQKMGMDLGLSQGAEDVLLGAALGRALIQEYLYQTNLSDREKPMHKSVLRAKYYVNENLAKPCSLDEIAKYSNVTPQHLSRIFKRDMMQTPIQYLWSLRAKKGSQMLRHSGLPVGEIAFRCGYDSANHFSRHIKENFGIPPTELRRRRWQS